MATKLCSRVTSSLTIKIMNKRITSHICREIREPNKIFHYDSLL